MDSNNWRPNQGTNPTMDTSDWRAQLPTDSRQRIVNRIMERLKRHLPVSGPDGLHELWKIAQRFEDKIFTAATSQADYLRKISLKMLTMETKSQNTLANNMPPNQVGPGNRPPDQGDWRAQLPTGSRQRIVDKIMETFEKHLPVSGPDGLHELRKAAQRFEDNIFTAATSQSDYLRKISLKMLTMETESQNTLANNMPPNQVGPSNKPPEE